MTARTILYWGFVFVVGGLAAVPLRNAPSRVVFGVGGLGFIVLMTGVSMALLVDTTIDGLRQLLVAFESQPSDPLFWGRFIAIGYALLVAASTAALLKVLRSAATEDADR